MENELFSGPAKEDVQKTLNVLAGRRPDDERLHRSWGDFFKDWPESCDVLSLYRDLLPRMRQFPDELIRKTNHEIAGWTKEHFKKIYSLDENLAWEIFDCVVAGLLSNDGSATAAWEVFPGEKTDHIGRPIRKAMNGPVGDVMIGCLGALKTLPPGRQGIPESFMVRMEKLLDSPGDGRKQAVAKLCRELDYIHARDPDWVKSKIAMEFDYRKPTADIAWSNFFIIYVDPSKEAGASPFSDVFDVLKPRLLDAASAQVTWKLDKDSEEIAAQAFVYHCICRRNETGGLTTDETRDILRALGDLGRLSAISYLEAIGCRNPENWTAKVAPFISRAWPLEKRYKTPLSVLSWIDLLSSTGDAFPDVYKAIRSFLKPFHRVSWRLGSFLRRKALSGAGCGRQLIENHPDLFLDVLDRIIPDDPDGVPSELAEVLEMIEESDGNLANKKPFIRLSDLARG